MSSRGPSLRAALVAGVLAGMADALVALATNPDPVLATYRLGYMLGPVLLGLALAVPGGAVGALMVPASQGARSAARVVAALWAFGVLTDAWRGGAPAVALAVLAAALAVAGTALARLAHDVSAALGRLPTTRRRLVWSAGLGTILMASLATAPSGAAAFRAGTGPCAATRGTRDRANVVLITIDSLRLDSARRMTSYGRLAARGIEFTQHVTLSPWTLPSVASLLTGLPLEAHGAGAARSWSSLLDKTPIRPHTRTLARAFGEQGWRTHAVVTNPFLTARYGIDEGFCTFENITMEGEAVRGLEGTTLLRFARAFAPDALPSDRADVVVERARRWLGMHGDAPFFLWIHLLDPHAPYGDRAGASTSLTLDLMALQGEPGLDGPFAAIGRLRAGELRPGPAERTRIRALYEADVAHADRALGTLLDELDARGLTKHTAIVLSADHGEEFWEHGGVEHGRTLFEEVLRVPLVIVPPAGLTAAEVRTELTSVVDVAPTVLALGGVDGPSFPGANLLGAQATPDRALQLGNFLFGEEWQGIRLAGLKYLRAEHGEERVYDLVADAGERTNVVASASAFLELGRAALGAGLSEPGSRQSSVGGDLKRDLTGLQVRAN